MPGKYIRQMDKIIETDLISEYVKKEYNVDSSKEYEIITVPARHLITYKRIDLMVKWIYIDSYVHKTNEEVAIDLYKAHLDAFSKGTFTECGQENSKNSFNKYLDTFNSLIDDISVNGFDSSKSIIPLGKDDVILDGSHRVAVCAYFDKEVTAVRIPGAIFESTGVYFRDNLMKESKILRSLYEYVKHDERCFFACLWPMASDEEKIQQAVNLIKSKTEYVYDAKVRMNFSDFHRFIAAIYSHQDWVGTPENNYSGAYGKAKACYRKQKPIHTIIFRSNSLEEVVELKKQIRDIFQIENHSVHISDSADETVQIAGYLYDNLLDLQSLEVMGASEKRLATLRKMGLYGRGQLNGISLFKEKIKRLINWKGINNR